MGKQMFILPYPILYGDGVIHGNSSQYLLFNKMALEIKLIPFTVH